MGIDMKNICTELVPNPHGESHVSEEHGASDCGGGGTRQHRTGRGTSDLVEAQYDVWNDVAFVQFDVCKRAVNLPQDVCGVVARRFADAHSAQAHADHETRAVEGYCSDVDNVQ